jgi:hypothetical protein
MKQRDSSWSDAACGSGANVIVGPPGPKTGDTVVIAPEIVRVCWVGWTYVPFLVDHNPERHNK